MSMTTTIAFPLSADLQDGDVQGALAELTDDLAVLLEPCALHPTQVARLALALCGVIPGTGVAGVVLHSDQYFLAPDPTEPMVMVVQVFSDHGCSHLEWPICPPGPRWDGLAAQHLAAAAFMTSVCA